MKCDGSRIRAGVECLEKQRVAQRAWSSIKTKNGQIAEGIYSILETQQEFYSDLYRKVNIDRIAASELLDRIEDTIDEDEKETYEARIKLEEVETIVKSLRKGCSPGIDGIINEFCTIYWSEIGKNFV